MKHIFTVLATLLAATFFHASAQTTTPDVWADFQKSGDIAYLLRKSPAQIMRYDVSSNEWLSPIVLDTIPTAFAIDDQHLYVAFDRSLNRYDLQGNNETHVGNTTNSIVELHLDDDFLFANQNKSLYLRISTFNKASFDLIEYKEIYVDGVSGAVLAPSLNKIFGRSQGYSPSDINSFEYKEDGTFESSGESPYHGDYPGASRVWLFPNESKVVDNSGTVYNTSDLTYANSFGNSITALDFYGEDIPITIIDDKLVSFSNTLLETGSYNLTVPSPKDLVVEEDKVIIFYDDSTLTTKVGVTSVALSELNTNEPGEAISPQGLAYEVDDTTIDADGILYLLSKAHASIFRWDLNKQEYLDTIPLTDGCSIVEYDAALNRLYLYAPPRKLLYIDLDDSVPSPKHLANTPLQINKLIPLGGDLLALQNGSWEDQWIYGSDGTLLASKIQCCYDDFHFFDLATMTLYVEYTYQTYLGNGEFGPANSIYNSDFNPLALSPNGDKIVGTTGLIYSASTLEQIDTLSNNVQSAIWDNDDRLYTVESYAYNDPRKDTHTNLQKWTEYNALDKEVLSEGLYITAQSYDNKIVLVTSVEGTPNFTLLNNDFSIVPPKSLATPSLELVKFTATAARFTWKDVHGEQAYKLERQEGIDGAWATVATIPFGTTKYTDPTLTPGSLYNYRLQAVNGDIASGYSSLVQVDLQFVADNRIDPTTLYFTPDNAFLSNTNKLYLLSNAHKSIFVWDVSTAQWETTIPLEGEPTNIAYSPVNNAIYTSYTGGKIYSISLLSDNPIEFEFATLIDKNVNGLVAADEFLAVSNSSRYLETYDASGSLVDSNYSSNSINDGIWDSNLRRIYYLDGRYLRYANILENGDIGTFGNSSYDSSAALTDPLRVHPNGGIILLGSGRIYASSSLEMIDALSTNHNDALWLDERLYTLGDTTLTAWNLDSYSTYLTHNISNTPNHLFTATDDTLVLVTSNQNQTFIDLLDKDLQPLVKSTPTPAQGLRAIQDGASGFSIAWSDATGESGYTLERSSDGSNWSLISNTDANVTKANDPSAQIGETYYYRVSTKFGSNSIASDSFELELTTPESVQKPTVTAPQENTLEISWTAVDNAIGYSIEVSQDDQNWDSFATTVSSETSVQHLNLEDGALRYYRVISIGIAGNATASPSSSGYTLIDAPLTPSSLVIDNYTALTATLRWDYSDRATHVRIERSEANGEWTTVETVAVSGFTYTDKSLAPETNYKYRVIALNSGGEASPVTSNSFITLALEIPLTPTHKATQTASDQVAITWDSVTNAQSYKIYRRTLNSGIWDFIGSTNSEDNNRFIDNNISIGSSYEYSVTASNSIGESEKSTPSLKTISAIEAIIAFDFEVLSDFDDLLFHSGSHSNSMEGSDGKFLYFGGSSTYLTITDIDLSYGGFISLDIKSMESSYSNTNPITLSYWNRSESEWQPFYVSKPSDISPESWKTLHIEIPETAAYEGSAISLESYRSSYSAPLGIDNLIIFSNIPEVPASSTVAFTQTNPEGGLAIFWLPSERAKTYTIKRSSDNGQTWLDLDEVSKTITHYIDSDAESGTDYLYQIVANNLGGASSPASTTLNQPDLDAITAFEAGKKSVLENLRDNGLHSSDTVSHMYFELVAEETVMDGNILSLPWYLYRSSDLINWSKQRLDLSSVLSDAEEAPKAFNKLSFEKESE